MKRKYFYRFLKNKKNFTKDLTFFWIFLAAILLALLWELKSSKKQSQLSIEKEEKKSPYTEWNSTHIPKDHILVPIEVANEATSSMIQNYARVDVFLPKEKGYQKIAENTVIIRAPLNPGKLALLMKETLFKKFQIPRIPVFITIRNPHSKPQKEKSKRKVFYGTHQ